MTALDAIRQRYDLSRVQLFVEDRTLTLQLVKLSSGAFGCEWIPERGESMHDALSECETLLAEQL